MSREARRVAYYVLKCPHCHRHFYMKRIKGDLKQCPSCGVSVRWRESKKSSFETREEAKELAIRLNERESSAGGSGISAKELLERARRRD